MRRCIDCGHRGDDLIRSQRIADQDWCFHENVVDESPEDTELRIAAAELGICLCNVGHGDFRTKCENCQEIHRAWVAKLAKT
jgi:hypothetical protein